MIITYGATKDRWRPEDKIHRPAAIPIPDGPLGNAVYLPPRQYQGQMSACVGESLSQNGAALAKKMNVFQEMFSPKWIWNGARSMEGCLRTNCGVQPGDAGDWIKKYGLLLDHYWPLDPNVLDPTPPPSADFPLAVQYPVSNWVLVTGNQDSICSAIVQYGFVSIGTPWFPQWEDIGPDGHLLIPQKGWYLPPDNWHETLLYDFDRKAGQFYDANSWGSLWGKDGLCFMPFEAFDRFGDYGGWDAMYLTVDKWPAEPKPSCWLKNLFA